MAVVATPGLVANARMYSVALGAAKAWRRLFALIAARSGVALAYLEHAFPVRLDELWSRPDLRCALMCGWPYALEAEDAAVQRPIIAAPVPDADWAEGRPQYHANVLVAAGAPARCLADTFGGRFAYNATASHSGYNLPRAALAVHAAGQPLFSGVAGPLTTPRRCVAPSASSSIPPLVGSPGLDAAACRRLCDGLTGLRVDAPGRAALADVCLSGFAIVEHSAYPIILEPERSAIQHG